jgi:HK97 family phage major capsid protein
MSTEDPETTRSAVTPDFDHREVQEHELSSFSFALAAEFAEHHAARQIGRATQIILKTDAHNLGMLSPEENSSVADKFRRADINIGRAKNYREIADKHAIAAAVKSEPRVYGPNSRHSWYMDIARRAIPGDLTGAAERLARYSQELAVEAKAGSREGKRALDVVSTRARSGGEDAVESERRAMTSGASSGGSFVTPQYVVDHQYALFNSYPPSFIEQTTKVPDAGYGMELYVPAFGSAAAVSQQTENTGVTNTSPTASYLSTPLVTFAGEVDVSQQFFDRAGPVGADAVIHAALSQQLDTAVNANAITQAIAGGATVTGAGSFTAANFLGDISKAKMNMETTAGTRLPATHVFMQPDFYEWSIAQVDPNGRPLLLPANSNAVLPIQTAADGSPPVGFTGERLLGTAVFTDGSIPNATTSTQTQIVVANAADVLTMTSEPVVRAFVETEANELTVIIQLYALTGCIVRHGTSVQVVSGAAYLSAPTFA